MTHRTLSFGSTGPEVKNLQDRLNALPSSLAALTIDGIFGARTQTRVKEFQRQRKLKADGIVGPLTWAALDQPPTPPAPGPIDPAWVCLCDNGHAAGRAVMGSTTQAATPISEGQDPSYRFSLPSLPMPGLTHLTATNLATPRVWAYFGQSVDFSRVYVTKLLLAGRLACTVSVNVDGLHLGLGMPKSKGTQTIQIMNLGLDPNEDAVIHQLTHVWQCQHCVNPLIVNYNCATSRYLALERNRYAATMDPMLASHRDYPANYPYSAFAHVIEQQALTLSAEQMAQAVQKGEKEAVGRIVSYLKGTMQGIPFRYQPTCADRRLPGVTI